MSRCCDRTATARSRTRRSISGRTATEISADALGLAQKLAAERSIRNIDFAVEDVHGLSFPDDSFDIAHAHQVLQHVADPVQALREMRRVVRPGGIVAARDADYAGFVWFPLLPELDEWLRLYREAARANGGEPDAGRRLLSWARAAAVSSSGASPGRTRRMRSRAAGFEEITATASTWCYANPEERAWWGGMWADRILESALARQLVDDGFAGRADLERVSRAWRTWADAGDGWFLVPHGEIIARA